jgi:hypothetical protein
MIYSGNHNSNGDNYNDNSKIANLANDNIQSTTISDNRIQSNDDDLHAQKEYINDEIIKKSTSINHVSDSNSQKSKEIVNIPIENHDNERYTYICECIYTCISI